MKDLKHIETPRGWVEIPTRKQLIEWNRVIYIRYLAASFAAILLAVLFIIGCVTGWKF